VQKLEPQVGQQSGPPTGAPFDLLLFGATGDLALRKLVPALYRRHLAGQVGPGSRVLAVARTSQSREVYIAQIEETCRKYLRPEEFSAERWKSFAALVDYVTVDATQSQDFKKLSALLAGREDVVRVLFLSTAPSLFTLTCNHLAAAGLVTPKSRVVLEKPLGQDRTSAEAINRSVGAIFAEHQIYRIDHYLGKETVQNLIALRFGNTLFEPLWRRGSIRHVQITVAEQLGVEGRGQFYDQTGALRDMVQSHLLQLVCILAMEPPASSDPDAVRDEKLKVLRALRPILDRDVQTKTVRAHYKAGAVNGQPVPGYLDEAGVPADSWYQDKLEGGGILFSDVCHFIDLAIYFAQSLPVEVSAFATPDPGHREESWAITLHFANGGLGVVHYVCGSQKGLERETIEIPPGDDETPPWRFPAGSRPQN